MFVVLIFYQFKALASVKWEFAIAGEKRDMLCDGMGNNDVVGGVFMILCRVETKAGVGVHNLVSQGSNLYSIVVLYAVKHLFRRFKMF